MFKMRGNIGMAVLAISAVAFITLTSYFYLNNFEKQKNPLNSDKESVIPSLTLTPNITTQESLATPSPSPMPTDPNTEQKVYKNQQLNYTLSYPSDWQLNEEVSNQSKSDIDMTLTNKGESAYIYMTAAPAGRGCYFMNGSNPNLLSRTFKIGGKQTTVEDSCFDKEYSIGLTNKAGIEIWLFTSAKDAESYKTIYRILESIQGLELTE